MVARSKAAPLCEPNVPSNDSPGTAGWSLGQTEAEAWPGAERQPASRAQLTEA
jgi:hypothetical protein